MSHTPGPWCWTDCATEHREEKSRLLRQVKDGANCGVMLADNYSRPNKYNEAVIAAAPEMFEFLAHFLEDKKHGFMEDEKRVRKIGELIAKIQGEK